MSRFLPRAAAAVVLGGLGLASVPAVAAAETLVGLTDNNRLITFDSRSPRAIGTPREVAGLQAGETLLAIDVRPNTDQLFAVGSTNRLYYVNPLSGAARAISGTAFTPGLAGANLGFDFNPTVDRVRVNGTEDQNLRLSPETGNVSNNDSNLAYAAGDAGAGTNPSVIGAGYTNSVPNSATTQLFDIDSARDALVLQDPPNAGTLKTVGALGVNVEGRGGFDIGTANVAYAVLTPNGESRAKLYQVNITTGAATPAATDPIIGTRSAIIGLAAYGPSSNDTNDPTVVANPNVKRGSEVRSDGVAYTVACNEACTVRGELRRGSTLVGTASSFVEQPGRVAIQINLSASGRTALADVDSGTLSLRTITRDYAGNAETVTRTITLVP